MVSDSNKFRAVIIGCGQIAGGYDQVLDSELVRTHAKAYKLQNNVDLVAVVDKDINKAHEFSEYWGVPKVYSDIEKMFLNEQIDIVSICTPDHTHSKLLEKCLNYRGIRAVWCEKPLSDNYMQAKSIVSAYNKNNIILAISYQRRWLSHLVSFKNLLEKKELGDIQKVIVFYTKGISHNGSHAIDLLSYFFCEPSTFKVSDSLIDFKATDPTVDVRIDFGDVPVYFIGLDERAYTFFEIQVMGLKGRAIIKSSPQVVEMYHINKDPQFEGHNITTFQRNLEPDKNEKTMALILNDIIENIQCKKTIRSNGQTALSTVNICDHIISTIKT